MSHPLVTIGVGSYNNARYVVETLESINNQTYSNIELIIVDDCSSDDSTLIIDNWLPLCRFPYQVIKNKKNTGIPAVCNMILKWASQNSEFLCLIGSDDVMENKRIESQVKFLGEDPGLVMCFCDMRIIDGKGEEINDSYFKLIGETITSVNYFLSIASKEQLEYIIRKNILPSPSFLFRTKVISDIKGWDEELYFEDWDMNLRLVSKGYKIGFSDEKLVKYRMLGTSAGRKSSPFFYSSILKLIFKYRGGGKGIDDAINEKLKHYSFLLYSCDGKGSGRWLFETWKADRKPKTLLLSILASMGIKYSLVKKFTFR